MLSIDREGSMGPYARGAIRYAERPGAAIAEAVEQMVSTKGHVQPIPAVDPEREIGDFIPITGVGQSTQVTCHCPEGCADVCVTGTPEAGAAPGEGLTQGTWRLS